MTSSTNSKRTCPFEDDNTILKKVKTSDQSNTCSKRPCPFDEGNASIKKPKTIATLLPKSNDEVSLDDHDAKRDSGKTYAQSESKHVRFTTQTTVLFEVEVGRNLYEGRLSCEADVLALCVSLVFVALYIVVVK
ncbi:unnamed protein product [Aphanomyces euteiches]